MGRRIIFVSVLIILTFFSGLSHAAPPETETDIVPPSIPEDCRSALVMEGSSGEIIFEHNSREKLPPASMTKMMLVLITMDRVKAGDLSLDDPITTSAHASRMGGSQVYLKHNEVFPLSELLKAVLIQSANDASMAIAEQIGGSSEGFVDIMNTYAARMGLEDTVYHSPHGLPPGRDQEPDLTSARDLAVLARALITTHPEILKWSCLDKEPFRDGKFIMTNTNRLVKQFVGCDGLKTGYYRSAGFSVTATAEQNGVRIIAVVMGCKKGKEHFAEASRLLRWGLTKYRKVDLITEGAASNRSIPVVDGTLRETVPVVAQTVSAIVRRNREDQIVMKTTLNRELTAPVETGSVCGHVSFLLDEKEIGRSDLVTREAIPALNWWGKFKRVLGM